MNNMTDPIPANKNNSSFVKIPRFKCGVLSLDSRVSWVLTPDPPVWVSTFLHWICRVFVIFEHFIEITDSRPHIMLVFFLELDWSKKNGCCSRFDSSSAGCVSVVCANWHIMQVAMVLCHPVSTLRLHWQLGKHGPQPPHSGPAARSPALYQCGPWRHSAAALQCLHGRRAPPRSASARQRF